MKLLRFLTEKSLYFGHSIIFYNKPEEDKALKLIKKKFPEHDIINPNNPLHQKEADKFLGKKTGSEMRYFIKVVDNADVGIFLVPKKGFTWGAGIEALRMLQKGKDVYKVDLKGNKLIKISRKDVGKLSRKHTYQQLGVEVK